MKNKLFRGLISIFVSFVSITVVSTPNITLAGKDQRGTWTSSQQSCIRNKLRERTKHDESAKDVERVIGIELAKVPYNTHNILEKLTELNDDYIVSTCLNENDLNKFTRIRETYRQQEQVFQFDNSISPISPIIERPRRTDSDRFTDFNSSRINESIFSALGNFGKTSAIIWGTTKIFPIPSFEPMPSFFTVPY